MLRKLAALVLAGGGAAALCLAIMALGTFTYGPSQSPPTINPPIDYVRGLIFDTVESNAQGQPAFTWSDTEIQMFTQIVLQQFQSAQFYSPPAGAFFPSQPTAYLRIAAYMLQAQAANSAKLAIIEQLLDVKLDASKAAAALNKQAQAYLEMDDNAGAFAIVEQVNDYFSFRDRFWKQVQRQQGIS